jgi:formylglycine-generating enzyme required for sulfatase activity
VTLPTEAQWEWACRAGTTSPFSFGDFSTDFSPFGNMGDASLRRLADEGWRPKSPDLVVRDNRFNDGELVSVEIGGYASNLWGLHDMHGNVAEWTRTTWQPYPYVDSSRIPASKGQKVVRGGSWRDRPQLCRSGSRLAYQPWQKVFNVGFRVVVELEPKTLAAK